MTRECQGEVGALKRKPLLMTPAGGAARTSMDLIGRPEQPNRVGVVTLTDAPVFRTKTKGARRSGWDIKYKEWKEVTHEGQQKAWDGTSPARRKATALRVYRHHFAKLRKV